MRNNQIKLGEVKIGNSYTYTCKNGWTFTYKILSFETNKSGRIKADLLVTNYNPKLDKTEEYMDIARTWLVGHRPLFYSYIGN